MSGIDPDVLKPLVSLLVDQLEQTKASLDSVTRGIASLISLAYPIAEPGVDAIEKVCFHPKMIDIQTMGGHQWICGDCGGSGTYQS